jgi:hypothetical protein
MEGKKKKLNEIAKESNLEIPDYFARKDAEAIKKWDDRHAGYCWDSIKSDINNCITKGLHGLNCPFAFIMLVIVQIANIEKHMVHVIIIHYLMIIVKLKKNYQIL